MIAFIKSLASVRNLVIVAGMVSAAFALQSLRIKWLKDDQVEYKEKITKLETRLESVKDANTASMSTIRELTFANKQCALDNLSNSKLNEALSGQHQEHVVTLNRELKNAKDKIKALGQNHCANNRIGTAFGLLPKN